MKIRAHRGLRQWSVAWLAMVLLAGCTSVPLTTMWKLRDFSVESFFAKDPTQMRVAIQVDKTMKRGPNSPMIALQIKAASTRPICYAFALDPVDALGKSELTLASAAADRRWYAFALSPSGVEAFRKAQRELKLKKQEEAEIGLNVTLSKVLDPAVDGAPFPLRIDLALDRADGYFTLIKETTVEPSRYRADASKPGPAAACGAADS